MEPFIGDIRLFAFSYAPQGFLLCNGSRVPIQQYQALFSLIGNIYGSSDATSFVLPDLRGRTPVCMGQSAGIMYNYPLGGKAGSETVTLTLDEMPSHNHQIVVSSSGASTNQPQGKILGAPPNTVNIYDSTPQTVQPMEDDMIGPSGYPVPLAHNNIQACCALNYCICAMGAYPRRP